MTYEQNLSSGLVQEILDLVFKYHDTMMLTTAIGCLELAKMELLEQHRILEEDEDEDEDH